MSKFKIILEVFVVAEFGAIVAVLIDFFVSLDGSLLHSISQIIDAVFGFVLLPRIPIILAAAVLIIFAGLLALYFRPLTRKGAFISGFGAIAMIAIFIP